MSPKVMYFTENQNLAVSSGAETVLIKKRVASWPTLHPLTSGIWKDIMST